jgi:quercetin dioxygenase-like cupin family protein
LRTGGDWEAFVKAKWTLFVVAACFGTIGAWGQEPEVLPIDAEPHHHLAFKNEYVKVYQVEVAPNDAVKLHRHDTDALSLSLSESLVTVHFPGKQDVQQKLANGQIRLQARGWVHSTSVQGDTPFRNDTVELLMPQSGERNGCAQVMAKEPMHCEGVHDRVGLGQPQFETDQTFVGLVRVKPHEQVVVGEPAGATLVVALDAGAAHSGESGKSISLRPGDFVWLDKGHAREAFRNEGATEVRLVCFGLARGDGASRSGK